MSALRARQQNLGELLGAKTWPGFSESDQFRVVDQGLQQQPPRPGPRGEAGTWNGIRAGGLGGAGSFSLSAQRPQGRLPRRSEVWSKEPDQDSRGHEGGWRDESLLRRSGHLRCWDQRGKQSRSVLSVRRQNKANWRASQGKAEQNDTGGSRESLWWEWGSLSNTAHRLGGHPACSMGYGGVSEKWLIEGLR